MKATAFLHLVPRIQIRAHTLAVLACTVILHTIRAWLQTDIHSGFPFKYFSHFSPLLCPVFLISSYLSFLDAVNIRFLRYLH